MSEVSRLEDLEILPQELGVGYISRVFLARHRQTGKTFAVKLINLKRVSNEEVETLNRELSIQTKMIHPNIVRLINWFQTKERLFIILEHVERGNLFELNTRRLTMEETVRIFFEVASAVEFLHGRGVVHRDIKPENILVDRDGRMKLCDFGFCAPFGRDVMRKTLCGTKEYLAPEVLLSSGQNEKVDVWCLGILLYELLHKKTPFDGRSPLAFEAMLRSGRIPLDPNLPRDIHSIITSCLAFDPRERPAVSALLGLQLFDALRPPVVRKPSENIMINIEQLNINIFRGTCGSPPPEPNRWQRLRLGSAEVSREMQSPGPESYSSQHLQAPGTSGPGIEKSSMTTLHRRPLSCSTAVKKLGPGPIESNRLIRRDLTQAFAAAGTLATAAGLPAQNGSRFLRPTDDRFAHASFQASPYCATEVCQNIENQQTIRPRTYQLPAKSQSRNFVDQMPIRTEPAKPRHTPNFFRQYQPSDGPIEVFRLERNQIPQQRFQRTHHGSLTPAHYFRT